MSTIYYTSPAGTARHPWLNKADTKFNPDGVFKLGLVLSGADAQGLKERIDTEVAAAMERYFETDEGKKVLPKDRKHWKAYAPYSIEEDDEGNPTGYIEFKFKQNQKLKLKDGTTKVLSISVLDAKKNPVKKPVFGGSELRVRYTLRDIVMKSLKQVGIQLAFGGVQVIKLATSNSDAAGGFDEVEGGYVEEDGMDYNSASSDNSGTGDY